MHQTPNDLGELERILVEAYAKLSVQMRGKGYGKRVGFGLRPAVVLVDLIKGFTEPNRPLGSNAFDNAVTNASALVKSERQRGIPVFLVTSSYDPACLEGGAWELKVDHSALTHGSPWVEFDERLNRAPSDQIVVKKYPSCFFATDLASRLVSQHVDTVILGGATTSGCIRASVVDACCSGFRTAVVKEAVGDHFILPHTAALYDIEMKYGDVTSLTEVIQYLDGIEAPRISASGSVW